MNAEEAKAIVSEEKRSREAAAAKDMEELLKNLLKKHNCKMDIYTITSSAGTKHQINFTAQDI